MDKKSQSSGILFYCDRGQPVPPLVVALATLVRSFAGPIHVVFGPHAPAWFVASIARSKYGMPITCERLAVYDFAEWSEGRRGSWCQKPFAIKRSPFDNTLYFDCDHLFTASKWTDDLWQSVDLAGLSSAHDYLRVARGRRIIRDFHAVAGVQLKTYRPVNGGCIGYRAGHEGLAAWIDYMSLFARQRESRLLRSLAEEYALGITLNMGLGQWLDARLSRMTYPHIDTWGYHLNCGRYLATLAWQQELQRCFAANFLGIRENAAAFVECDKRIKPILLNDDSVCPSIDCVTQS